jgi:hypothetical protein
MPRLAHGASVSLEQFQAIREEIKDLNAKSALPFPAAVVPQLTRFDYLFPKLQNDETALLPTGAETVAALVALGEAMRDKNDEPALNAELPAAYTYFGQFIAHDITAELIANQLGDLSDPQLAPLTLAEVRTQIRNRRSATLDLDSIYDQPAPRNGALMQLGRVSPSPPRPANKDDFNDLPRTQPSPNPSQDRAARIGDARNDDNLIIAQLHVAFLRAHNALVGRGHNFTAARTLLRQHFQWLVLHDFLPRIADPSVVASILAQGNRVYAPPAQSCFMPFEFSAAAFRFGHSLMRRTYHHNANFTAATLGQLFTLTALRGNLNPAPHREFDTLPENWIIEWEHYIPGPGLRNRARRIDTRLVEPLFELRGEVGQLLPGEPRLAVRNLLRGYRLRIPTGQAVARAIGLSVLTPTEIEAAAANQDQVEILRASGLSARTPLWFYILAEAARDFNGRLGPVGSTLVAEVLIGLARSSADSILNYPAWRPTLGSNSGQFTLPDLLRLAGVLNETKQVKGAMAMANNQTNKVAFLVELTISPVSSAATDNGQVAVNTYRIIDKVRQVKSALQADPVATQKNRERAVAAIGSGIGSAEWKEYMQQFADTPQQLARLTATDGTAQNPSLKLARAYLVANAVCGPGTLTNLDLTVDGIDDGL